MRQKRKMTFMIAFLMVFTVVFAGAPALGVRAENPENNDPNAPGTVLDLPVNEITGTSFTLGELQGGTIEYDHTFTEYKHNENWEVELDENGNPIPVTTTLTSTVNAKVLKFTLPAYSVYTVTNSIEVEPYNNPEGIIYAYAFEDALKEDVQSGQVLDFNSMELVNSGNSKKTIYSSKLEQISVII